MKVTLFDYGAGNLHSLAKAVTRCGFEPTIEADPIRAAETDCLLLPGVGAFAHAATRLAPGRDRIRAALSTGLPCLGICLGMQLLFETSEEGDGEGVGLFEGRVTRLRAKAVPQIGWNTIDDCRDPVIERARLGDVYYANSYVCRPLDEGCIVAWSEHQGDRFAAAVRRGAVLGVQFHPEKSSDPGVALIDCFLAEAAR